MNSRSLANRLAPRFGDESQDIIVAITTVLLGASMVDAIPRNREIRLIRRTLNRSLRVESSQTRKVLRKALLNIMHGRGFEEISQALETLKSTLSVKQRVSLYSTLFSIIMVDGHVDRAEKYYLDLVADKLGLADAHIDTSSSHSH